MPSLLSAKHYHDEEEAYRFVERHIWPQGPVCPHCGCMEKIGKLQGKSTRMGVYKCYDCRKPFTVKVGTVFEASHVKLHVWLQAIFLMCGSKKGISSHQLHRMLGVTLKTAWFLSHRVREAMKSGDLSMFGQGGGIVEADEGFIGTEPDVLSGKVSKSFGVWHKMKVLALVDRDTGRSHARVIDFVAADIIRPILQEKIQPEATLVTDQHKVYNRARKHFARHEAINHADGEHRRGEFHTNNLEAYFSVFKRGMLGTYQHCGKQHLNRYLAEFDFRYSNRVALGVNDAGRSVRALEGIVGKRLMYRQAVAK